MVLVQVNFNAEENKLLNMIKLAFDLDSKEEAVRYSVNQLKERIEQIKKKNTKELEEAEKQADNCPDPTEEEEEEMDAYEELMGA